MIATKFCNGTAGSYTVMVWTTICSNLMANNLMTTKQKFHLVGKCKYKMWNGPRTATPWWYTDYLIFSFGDLIEHGKLHHPTVSHVIIGHMIHEIKLTNVSEKITCPFSHLIFVIKCVMFCFSLSGPSTKYNIDLLQRDETMAWKFFPHNWSFVKETTRAGGFRQKVPNN